MTAINVVKRPDGIYVFTDGSILDSHGVVCGFQSKVATLPHLPAVVCCRGWSMAPSTVGAMLGMAFSSFDELVAGVAALLPTLVKQIDFGLQGCNDNILEFLIAGFSSRRGRYEAYFIRNSENWDRVRKCDNRDAAIMPAAFELVELLDDISVMPMPTGDELRSAGIEDSGSPDIEGTLMLGMKLLAVQRQMLIPTRGGSYHIVGGFAQMTRLGRNSIVQSIPMRWPDRIGELITLVAAAEVMTPSNVASIQPLENRRQRRAREREQRKKLHAV